MSAPDLTPEDRAAIAAAVKTPTMVNGSGTIISIMTVTDKAIEAIYRAGMEREREACAAVALTQRCERGTPWDLACTTIATAIRARSPLPREAL